MSLGQRSQAVAYLTARPFQVPSGVDTKSNGTNYLEKAKPATVVPPDRGWGTVVA